MVGAERTVMRKLSRSVMLGLIYFLCLASDSNSATLDPLTDLAYVGAFKMPASTDFALSGYGLTFYPAGNGGAGSLFIAMGDANSAERSRVAEISIPTPVNSKSAASLNAATVIQNFSTVIDLGVYADQAGGLGYVPKQGTQGTDKVYYTVYNGYNVSETAYESVGYFNVTLSSPDTRGPWYPGSTGLVNKMGRYIFPVPSDWAATYVNNRFIFTGGSRGGANQSSRGPTLYAFAPWTTDSPGADRAVIPATTLLQYEDNADESFRSTYPGYGPCDRWRGGVWITSGNKRAVLFAGAKGTSNYEYINGYVCNPMATRLDWYDPADFEAVALGKKKPNQPIPYSNAWSTSSFIWHPSGGSAGVKGNEQWFFGLAGVAHQQNYIGSNGRLFIAELGAESRGAAAYPIIHVFNVMSTGGGGMLPPKLLRVITPD
jgi:hypothetical protein